MPSMPLNYEEIVTVARSESVAAVTFDMRKFPNAQEEAIETFLQNTAMGAQMGVLTHTKPIVIVCDSKAAISPRAAQLLAALQAIGVSIGVQRYDS